MGLFNKGKVKGENVVNKVIILSPYNFLQKQAPTAIVLNSFAHFSGFSLLKSGNLTQHHALYIIFESSLLYLKIAVLKKLDI